MNDHGYVDVKDEIFTDVEGIFAAGDVSDEVYRQLSTSVGGRNQGRDGSRALARRATRRRRSGERMARHERPRRGLERIHKLFLTNCSKHGGYAVTEAERVRETF